MQKKNWDGKIQFEVSLVEHCNLNCARCDHFSPLAKEEYLDTEEFEKDIKRMSYLFNCEAEYLYLVGGEPLLHPKLCSFISIARYYFPNTDIRLYTNGLLLQKMSDLFWKCCMDNKITISLSKYPIKSFDYENLVNLIKLNGVNYVFSDSHEIKRMTHCPLDLTGSQDADENFKKCYHANFCIQLRHGKLYPCTIAPNAYHYENFFKIDLNHNTQNGVDIYFYESAHDVLKNLNKPIEFCKYCMVSNRTSTEWKISKKTKDEW